MYDQPLIFGASLLNLESGEKKTGTGIPVKGDRAVCVWIDPKDKWIWHGSKEGRMVRTVPGSVNSWSKRSLENGGVTCLAADKKGKTLAVGGSDGTIRFVNAKGASVDKKKVFETGSSEITALALDGGGSTVLAGCADGNLTLRSAKSGKVKAELTGHEAPIVSVAISPRGKWVASSDESGACRLWEVKSGEQIAVVEGESGAVVLGLHFVGKSQLFGTDDNRIAVWDLSDL